MGRSSDEVIIMVADHLDDLARTVHDRLGEVVGVAVTMASADGRPMTVGGSTELARAVDLVQYDIGFGPCLRALRGDGGAYVPDLAIQRWGAYGRAAADLGVRSCVSIPVERAGEVVAVTKVYAAEVDGLSPVQRQLGVELATEVGGSIGLARTLTAQAHELDDRASAMDTRRVIDLAIGVIMERAQCSADVAFATLKQQSQHTNTSVTEVARTVVSAFGVTRDPAAPFDRAPS
ncbi:MAG TPA: GAF and ANTAR domain-containing protein [Microlunatus sp.]|nr:GAF and ANTAR domain-containing protein [Microlunatus sp.]